MAKKEKNLKEKKEKKQKNSSYFKEMKAELKKVVWPTPKELLNNTVAVIGFVLIIAVIVFILDLCFDNLNKYGITRLQEKVQSSFQSDEDENTVSNEVNENNNSNTDVVVEDNSSSEGVTDETSNSEENLNKNATTEDSDE